MSESGPRRKKDWESLIDQQIREAQQRGDFDDLPGKGRPLDLRPNPHAPDRELAYKILKDAGYAPEWIEFDKAIRAKTEAARAALVHARNWYEARLAEFQGRNDSWALVERKRASASWRQAVSAFAQEVAGINKEIADLNLKVPSPRFQRLKLDVSHEIARLGAGVDTEP